MDNEIEKMENAENMKKAKKPFYKKAWFWILAVFVFFVIVGNSGGGNNNAHYNASQAGGNYASNNEEPEIKMTIGQRNAIKSARNYTNMMGFSKSGLIKQLEFEGYSTADATFGAENCGADWNEMAAKSAKNYIASMPFSKKRLIEQLQFDGYTQKQAEYGAKAVGY